MLEEIVSLLHCCASLYCYLHNIIPADIECHQEPAAQFKMLSTLHAAVLTALHTRTSEMIR